MEITESIEVDYVCVHSDNVDERRNLVDDAVVELTQIHLAGDVLAGFHIDCDLAVLANSHELGARPHPGDAHPPSQGAPGCACRGGL